MQIFVPFMSIQYSLLDGQAEGIIQQAGLTKTMKDGMACHDHHEICSV